MASNESAGAQSAPQPLHWQIAFLPFVLLGLAVGACVSAIMIEWAGMALGVWALPGAGHARDTLVGDIQYLNADFTRSILGVSPVELAVIASRTTTEWIVLKIESLGVMEMMQQLGQEGSSGVFSSLFKSVDTGLSSISANAAETNAGLAAPNQLYHGLMQYFDAAIYAVQTVVVRIVVAILSLPAYLLIGLVCLLDGIVARDLRRFTAANESSFAYHRYKPWVVRFFVVSWYAYIAWPTSIHPNAVFVPSALLCGWATFNTAKWFKKFF